MKTILIVDDIPQNITLMAQILKNKYRLIFATNGPEAIKISLTKPDLILLDIVMPEMDGYDVCKQIKKNNHTKFIPIIFVTTLDEEYNEAKGLDLGAVDYICKPFSSAIVNARIKTHLELNEYRDSLETLVNQKTIELQKALVEIAESNKVIKNSHTETIYRLTLAAEYKDEITGNHLKRISLYTKELASAMGLDSEFIDTITNASPMHDIGKVGIPDSVLFKNGPLTSEEWEIIKSHTKMGMEILKDSTSPYLQMGAQIAHFHHERWNGGGYPLKLKGDEIPLSARITNIADQYDALRSKRPYKKGLDHDTVIDILLKGDGRTMPEHFDPEVLDVFRKIYPLFKEIFE